jgi:molecular chaperone GrpE (heat shock protein)
MSELFHNLGRRMHRALKAFADPSEGVGGGSPFRDAPPMPGGYTGSTKPAGPAQRDAIAELCDGHRRELNDLRSRLEQRLNEESATAKREASGRLRLLKDLGATMDELDEVVIAGGEIGAFAEGLLNRFEDILTQHDLERLDHDSNFDILRHKAVGGMRAAAGAPIGEVLRPGFAIRNEIIRRAHVRVIPESGVIPAKTPFNTEPKNN